MTQESELSGAGGIVFDIREFAVHDGPGIRTTVFLKGCPLRCAWCHNPESQSPEPQTLHSPAGDRRAGTLYSARGLADILNSQAEILQLNGGGVTFSGGEPLAQADFVIGVIALLGGMHVVLDTSGYADEPTFRRVVECCDLVLYDLKLIDRALHLQYTGADNDRILGNLQVLDSMAVPYIIRVPLVPGVTDTAENVGAIAAFVGPLRHLDHVELLPYNRSAGGKYAACGATFSPDWDEDAPVRSDIRPFEAAGVVARVR